MSLENLRGALPDYAKDLKLNLGSLSRSKELTETQLWGAMVAAAAATRNATVLREVLEDAQGHLSEEELRGAKLAASIMGMNNVAYRAKEYLGQDYQQVRMGLRQNQMLNPGVDKVNFELWNIAVSVINGCEQCTAAHEHTVREEGVKEAAVWETVKVAAVLSGVAQALFIEGTTE